MDKETENIDYEHQFYNEFTEKCVDLLVECYNEYNSSEELIQYINDNWELIRQIKNDGFVLHDDGTKYNSLIHYLFVSSDYQLFNNSNDVFGELLPMLIKSVNNFDELFEDDYLQYRNGVELEEITNLLDSFIDEIRTCEARRIEFSDLNYKLKGNNYSGEEDYLIEVKYDEKTYLVTNNDCTLLDYGIINEYYILEEYADMAEESLIESIGSFLTNEWLHIDENSLWNTAKEIISLDGHNLDICNEYVQSGISSSLYNICELN